MTDDELAAITLAHGFGPAILAGGTSVVAGKPEKMLPLLREIERRALERALSTLERFGKVSSADLIRSLIEGASSAASKED